MSDGTIGDQLGFVKQLERSSAHKRVVFLMRVAYELTIRARDTYDPAGNGVVDPARLRGANELMHRLTHRALRVAADASLNVTERDFWLALTELAEQSSCRKDLVAAATAANAILSS